MSTDFYLQFLDQNNKGKRVFAEAAAPRVPFKGGGGVGARLKAFGPQNPSTVKTHKHGANEEVIVLDIQGLTDQLINYSGTGPGSTNISMLIWGRPGIGKSAIAASIAENKIAPSMNRIFVHFNRLTTGPKEELYKVFDNPEDYYVFIDIRAGAYEKYEFKGIPQASKAIGGLEGTVDTLDMQWIKLMTLDNSAGFLFLDEINQADPGVQGVLFSLFHEDERILAEQGIRNPSCWSVHGAGNLTTGGVSYSGTQKITRALINRCLICMFDVNFDEWIVWAKTFDKNGAPVFNDLILSFLKYVVGSSDSKDKLKYFSYENPDYEVTGDPNPRNFAQLSKMIEGIMKKAEGGQLSVKEVIKEIRIASGMAINNMWAEEFVYYIERFQKINLEDILANPEKHLVVTKGKGADAALERKDFYINMSAIEDYIADFIPTYLRAFNYEDYIEGNKNVSQNGVPPAVTSADDIDINAYNASVDEIFNIVKVLTKARATGMDISVLTNALTNCSYKSQATGRSIKLWGLFMNALHVNYPEGYNRALEIAGGSKELKAGQAQSGLGALSKGTSAPVPPTTTYAQPEEEEEGEANVNDLAAANDVLENGLRKLLTLKRRL